MATRKPTMADTALELIRARGPMTIEQLTPELVAAGRTRAKNPLGAVSTAIRYNTDFLEHPNGLVFSRAAQLEGAMFAVRPTALERDNEIVVVREDLVLVETLLRRRHDWRDHDDRVHLDDFADYFDLPVWDIDRPDDDDDSWLDDEDDDENDDDDDGVSGAIGPDAVEPVGVDDSRDRPSTPVRLTGDDDEDDDPEEAAMALREMLGEGVAEELVAFMREIGLPPGNEDTDLRDLIWELRYAQIIHGPQGWMPRLAAGQVLGLTVRGGEVRASGLSRRDVRGPHVSRAVRVVGDLGRQVLGVVDRAAPGLADEFGVPLQLLLELVAMEAPEVFREPLPPLQDVIRRAGLDLDDGLVCYWQGPGAGLRVLGRDPEDDEGQATRLRLLH